MMKHGKKYREAAKLVEQKAYTLDEAIELLKKTATTKFDGSCEIHIKLGVDPKQADQNVRTAAALPHGTGKKLTIVAFVSDENAKAAKEAGAKEAGTNDLIKKIEKGWTDFDVAVATPDQMKELGKIAKILGQKRLMPSPKAGTVTPDFKKAIEELNKGKVELRLDPNAILHNIFGKVSFDNAKLRENLVTLVKAVLAVKPSGSKGTYLRSMTVATTMGPGIHLDISSVTAEARK
ncbi:50S ribosomal protein L1 [Candidatus Peregrinibacteria bacterium]|nr:50S ribosomal protein L1 [Candidatus Peregrinibacteria bacterium]